MIEAEGPKVEAWLEDVPGAEPRCWIKVKRPGSDRYEEISYRELLARPAAIREDTAIKQEASRQYRALIKERKLKVAHTSPPVQVDLSQQEKVERLKAILSQGPGTRLMDLELHRDADRGPLYILAKRMVERGELIEHPTTKALSFPRQGPTKHESGTKDRDVTIQETPEEVEVRVLHDVPPFKSGDGREHHLKQGEMAKLPPSYANVLISRGKAEKVEQLPLEGKEAFTAKPEPQTTIAEQKVADPSFVETIPEPKAATEEHKPWMDMDWGGRSNEQPTPRSLHTLKLLDISKDDDGNLSIEAIIKGERKKWRVADLEMELSEKSTQYPPLVLEILHDKVNKWKAQHEAKGKGRDPVDLLLDLARQDGLAEFFHDAARVPFVRVESGDHHEVKAVREDFIDWLRYRAVKAVGKAPKREPLAQAIDTLAVLAQYEGDEREVYIRKGEHEGAFYYDLCNESWQAIMITAEGWRVVDDPPAMFRRFDHMRPQVIPLTGRPKALDELLSLVNTSEEMRRLLKYHLIASQVPRINHYNAFFLGPQGSTKSTGNDIFKALDDPGTDNRDALPNKEDDLDLHLSRRCTAAYDNISKITLEVSDMLTRANSMSRSSRRALYTNNEENSRRYKTKIVLNAIGLESGVRPDLLDRTIIYNCEVVTEAQRMGQDEVNARIEELQPYALGASLDTLVKAMPIYQELKGRKGWSPRLKDAYLWMMAIAKVDGMTEGDFEALFKKVIERRDSDAMEGDPLAVALEFIAARDGFVGTAGQLHEWLNDPGLNIPEACHIDVKDKMWPKSGIALGIRLPRIIAPLRSRGVFVYQCYHFEVGRNFTDKVRDLNWAKRRSGAYRDQDRMILIAKADIKGTEARSEA